MKDVTTKYILKFLAVFIAVCCFSIVCFADSYDPLRRITGIVDSEDFLMSESFDYDLNGNPTSIVRGGNGNDTMDNITLEYDGNQIVSVSDNPTFDFELGKIPQLVAGNYPNAMAYDENGRPKYDRSRNVEQIQYNHLDLPTYVRFGKNADNLNDGVYYTYRADGVKMSEISSQRYIKMITTIDKNGNSVTKPRVESNNISRSYYGNVVKTNGELRFYNEMGYVDYDAKADSAIYYYCERDYLGSVRAIVDKNGAMMQAMDYYSTGIPHSKLLVQPVDNRMHTGKEFQNLNGLGWYDNSARQMDAILGRFTTPDKLSEKYPQMGGYTHCANNPLRLVDKDGNDIIDAAVGYGIGIITNIIPGTGGLRDCYSPTDRSDYNNALQGVDNASLAMAPGMINTGNGGMALGTATVAVSITTTAASGGTLAVGGVPVASAGLALTAAGATTSMLGSSVMANASNNKNDGYDRGKNDFTFTQGDGTKAKKVTVNIPKGYTKIKERGHAGMPIFKKGNSYISPDKHGHNGGVWKKGDSVKELQNRNTRNGTYDENLNKIGD